MGERDTAPAKSRLKLFPVRALAGSQSALPLVPHFPTVEAVLFSLHRIGAWALGVLITAHAVNALVRHFVIRDNTLARMAPVLGTGRGIGELALERGNSQTAIGR